MHSSLFEQDGGLFHALQTSGGWEAERKLCKPEEAGAVPGGGQPGEHTLLARKESNKISITLSKAGRGWEGWLQGIYFGREHKGGPMGGAIRGGASLLMRLWPQSSLR